MNKPPLVVFEEWCERGRPDVRSNADLALEQSTHRTPQRVHGWCALRRFLHNHISQGRFARPGGLSNSRALRDSLQVGRIISTRSRPTE
jgi:hypothetical protein